VATDFGSNFPAYKRFFFKPVQKLFGRTVQKGAETIVFAASSPTLTGTCTFTYFLI
jgi:hypothetical protein